MNDKELQASAPTEEEYQRWLEDQAAQQEYLEWLDAMEKSHAMERSQ